MQLFFFHSGGTSAGEDGRDSGKGETWAASGGRVSHTPPDQ